MEKLITNYSMSEILLFIVVFACAIKGVVSFYDWGYERLKKIFNKENKQEQKMETIEERLELGDSIFKSLSNKQLELEGDLQRIINKINLLIDSDKDDIKAYITEKHHHFVYEKQWIDDYSLDCLERRYSHYKEEGGNSFIKELMDEIRALDKKPPYEEPED